MITAVIAASLLAFASGLAVKYYLDGTRGITIDVLQPYEKHWKTLNGDPISLESLKGRRVLLNFWGSWCPPCVEEMPLLERFSASHRDQIMVIGVVVDREEPARNFLEKHNIKFPSIFADAKYVSQILDLLGESDGVLPYSVAFSQTGRSMFSKIGPVSEQELLSLIE